LKVSQNDLSFAVFIVIPILMAVIRSQRREDSARAPRIEIEKTERAVF
jgi:hypothetical protein